MSDEKSSCAFSDCLDSVPLGTAEEERLRAKWWADLAEAHARNERYWRDRSHMKMPVKTAERIRRIPDKYLVPQGGLKEAGVPAGDAEDISHCLAVLRLMEANTSMFGFSHVPAPVEIPR
jgi:hypothetical protein